MNNDTYTPCTKCGRPMAYCKGQCCGQPKGCGCKEYCSSVRGAIRQCQPDCPHAAVIPSITVDHADNLKDLCDTFVHVSDLNTTFYIDDKHRTIITWAGPVEYDNYDLDANSLGLRSQFLIDFANERGAYYNKTGNYEVFNFGNNADNNALSFTMQYNAGTVGSGFPGWSQLGTTELITKNTYNSDVLKMAIGWDGFVEYPVTFLNDATDEVITPQDLYALLLDGADVTLNHVPLGWMLAGEAFHVDPYCDGVHLTKYFTSDGAYNYIGFGGSASVSLYFPNVNNPIQTQFGFSILGYEEEGSMVFSSISVQGLYAA